jgi:hypothetical protein
MNNNGLKIKPINMFYVLMMLVMACSRKADQSGGPSFVSTPQQFTVDVSKVKEASGIADSKVNPGYMWVEQDSGNPPDLFLVKHDGTILKTVHLDGINNRDWEDICVSAGPQNGKSYVYVAETGDNNLIHTESVFYRFVEPASSVDTVKQIDKISFQYPDGSHDAEAFLVDPATKDIYIITKQDNPSKLFKLTYPYSTTSVNMAELAGALTYNFVVSAAWSADGKGIVVKTYGGINYYPAKTGESIVQVLKKSFITLPYQTEPQGEAITFAADNSGYYTLSEKSLSSSVNLYFYKRK